ncbi:hypothetical protein [Macrococcus sp. DPC7161]|uniref:hypothetical protein n=1 Tax=Macrococcus sp. DPC7161 TaxID=2507060 RepID=UPI00100B5AF2|nr:hypothetical protein [Macrococcus sp. DPC7161]RXK17592.1 hypothetical protein ER639_09680 [Macrococcus sp. DPC7161]
MLFLKTPVNKLLPNLYTLLFVLFVLLIFEQILQLIVALIFPDIYSVLPFTLDIFFTEDIANLLHIPSWIVVIIIIAILIALTLIVVEMLVQYNEMQEELFIGDEVDRHLYQAVFTRPQVKYHDLPIYTGDFMRDNKSEISLSHYQKNKNKFTQNLLFINLVLVFILYDNLTELIICLMKKNVFI